MLKHELLLADGTLLTRGPDAGAVSMAYFFRGLAE